ncbi:PREDICTED: uncharacterized protein LOC105571145, partial [Vollenhovia emeryi]|uniref:uncharacterized protein LOC105571145 n=1 Tax=Vollenhovia emeryi TaxID=411798 RepID=UPI0005F41A91
MGEPVPKSLPDMDNKSHTTRREAKVKKTGNSQETKDGRMGRVLGKTRQGDPNTSVAAASGTKPGPACSKVAREAPLPLDSDGSETEEMVDVDNVSSTDDEWSSAASVDKCTGKRKKRGWPPKTVEGIKAQKKAECKRELKKLKAEKKALEEVLNPRMAPRSKTPERDIMHQMEVLSKDQLAAEMLGNIDVVVKVAERSSNLKGTFVKELKASANKLRAAAVVVSRKTASSTNAALEEETVRLRERVRSLEDQVATLTTLLSKEREVKASKERAKIPEEDMEVEMQEVHLPRVQVQAQNTADLANPVRTRAQNKKEKAKTEGATMDPVYRPAVRGERKRLEEPSPETAMEGVRTVMEGVSIKEITKGDPQEVKRNLEHLIARCQGALVRIPREEKPGNTRSLPSITKVEVVKNKLRLEAKETAERIIRDSQAPRGQTPTSQDTSWVEVVKRGGKRKPGTRPANTEASSNAGRGEGKLRYADVARAKQPSSQPAKAGKASLQIPAGEGGKPEAKRPQKAVEETRVSTAQGAKATAKKRRRAPRSEAVSITFPAGEGAEGMREIRARINLETLGIGPLKQRRGLTGALIFEVSGPESAKKADALANEMRGAVAGKEGVRISRPKKMAEIRIKDVDECGGEGHKAQACTAEVKCPVCSARGLPAQHKAGGAACPLPTKKTAKKGRRTETMEPREGRQAVKEATKGTPMETEPLLDIQGVTPAVASRAGEGQEEAAAASPSRLAERGCGLGIVAEPYRVPKSPLWAGSADGSAAIVWRRTGERAPSLVKLKAGEGWVAVKWGPLVVIGVYLRPSLSRAEAEGRLEELEDLVREYLPGPILVAGDFNAKSALWGSRRPDVKGADVEAWAARLGLHLENVGDVSTCVRPQGESIVDLTWTSPAAARRICGWEVVEGLELLSDHLPIRIDFSWEDRRREPQEKVVRWRTEKLDPDKLKESLIAELWAQPNPAPTVDEEAQWLQRTLMKACDAAMPRAKFVARRAAYWWSGEIEELRKSSVAARRAVLRARRRRRTLPEEEANLVEEYRQRRKALRDAIRTAKERAWEELISSLNEDPWGRPYKLVMNRLSSGAPPTVETLSPRFLQEVVETLFPAGNDGGPPPRGMENGGEHQQWREELGVTRTELARAAKKLKRGKAPGPDGVPGIVLKAALGELSGRLEGLYTRCLAEGVFPGPWKKARLVLLPKEGKPPDEPGSFRPICLLDEAGKLLERVVASRLMGAIENTGPGLSERQFGFREGRSTVDAIVHVREMASAMMGDGGVVLAVALDVANAFNSIPHREIVTGLEKLEVPGYLRVIIGDYLRDRSIVCVDREGDSRTWRADRGVPQGSVLGPLLWDVAYDGVLRAALPAGCTCVCYADDTLVLAGGEDWGEAIARGNLAVACAVRAIRALGLRVAAKKTEAVFFHDGSARPPPEAS